MINIDRYHRIGQTYVNISRAPRLFTFGSWGSRPRLSYVAPTALNGLRPILLKWGLRPRLESVAASRLLIVACQGPGYLVPVSVHRPLVLALPSDSCR